MMNFDALRYRYPSRRAVVFGTLAVDPREEGPVGAGCVSRYRGRSEARGHEVEVLKDSTSFGRGEMILRMASGSLAGATEPRTDGCVAVW